MKIGFIGCGNMATAMLKGILKSGEVAATDMIASAKSDKTRKKIEQELGIQKADTNAQVVDFADVVFLAVKPQFLEGVLNEIKDSVKEEQIFISIAPGKTIQWFADKLGEKTKVIRTMPNTPAMLNLTRSSKTLSTRKRSQPKAHGAGIGPLQNVKESGSSATISAAEIAARPCSGTSTPSGPSGKAGRAATLPAACGCESAMVNCSKRSRCL